MNRESGSVIRNVSTAAGPGMRLGRLSEPLERTQASSRHFDQRGQTIRSFDRTAAPADASTRVHRRDRLKRRGPKVQKRQNHWEGSDTEPGWTDAGVIMLTHSDVAHTLEMFQPERAAKLPISTAIPSVTPTIQIALEPESGLTRQRKALLASAALVGGLIGLAYTLFA